MAHEPLFGGIYADKTALVTGHSGFKGSWLVLWLEALGCRVIGYSLPAPTEPNHLGVLPLCCTTVTGDVLDRSRLAEVVRAYRPDMVFHLAAQPLVRRSYRDPIETFDSNVLGTVSVLEACRTADVSPRAIVCVTSDKVYENRECAWGYRETDILGGYDPYSCSKACTELIACCYRNSYFNLVDYGRSHHTLLATARAGNVIGGGDWAEDRLVPDLVRAASEGRPLILRNPHCVRPWQHVLEPLSGYLLLGQKLLAGEAAFAGAWNFGPDEDGAVPVESIVQQFRAVWPRLRYESQPQVGAPHEAGLLKLDSSKARDQMGWLPVWKWTEAVAVTAEWYRAFYESGQPLSLRQLDAYVEAARRHDLSWSQA
ncbi:MAG TPA: CDP-glucose 4,6-dehydratase [Gemmataceae bacterium]|nr:CDP-glucose 4,6-dehydratase [Gemmataceae bacterium]